MFEKKEDKLFDYAFGELNAHDAQVFEAALLSDEASAEEAKFLQSLKSDLVSLRDIPEMQYSKERLRDAILGQGLKPSKPAFPWLNWVLAPSAMACVFALGYVMMNGTSKREPVLVSKPPAINNASTSNPFVESEGSKVVDSRTSDDFPDVQDTHWAYEGSDGKVHVTPSYGSETSKSSAEKMVKYSIHSRSGSNSREVGNPAIENNIKEDSKDKSRAVSLKTGAAPGAGPGGIVDINYGKSSSALRDNSSDMAPKGDVQSDSDVTLILIDKDQDSGVGAAVATEVNNRSHVVIGG